MARYSIDGSVLDNIANAINAKTGETAAMLPGEMAEKISSIEGSVVKENFSLNYDDLKSYIRMCASAINAGKIVLGSIELMLDDDSSFSGGYQVSATYFRLVSIMDAYIIMFLQYDMDNNRFRGYQYTYDDVSDTCEFSVLSDEQMSQMNFSVSFTAYTFS